MLPDRGLVNIRVLRLSREEAQMVLRGEFKSIVGHHDTCNIIEKELGIKVEYNRASTKLDINDACVVAQYMGPRLPEGATTLPKDAHIQWMLLRFN